jgi:hypothetical protein
MNRWLIAMVTGLLVTGCAAGVEDPQPAPPPDPVQKDPPAQTFSGELEEDPYDSIARTGLHDGVPNLPPRQKPPVPGLMPVPVEE